MKMYRIAHKVTARGVYSHNYYCFIESLPYEHSYLDDISVIHGHTENTNKTPCKDDDCFVSSVQSVSNTRSSLDDDATYIYGFNTLSQLEDWFSPIERETLDSLGFHVLELEVEEFCLYKHQMIVTLDHYLDCKVVNLITLRTLEK